MNFNLKNIIIALVAIWFLTKRKKPAQIIFDEEGQFDFPDEDGNYDEYDEIFNEDRDLDIPDPKDYEWKKKIVDAELFERQNDSIYKPENNDFIIEPLPKLTEKDLSDANALAYAKRYPDLKAAFGNDLKKLKWHWLNFGINENRTFGIDKTQNQISMELPITINPILTTTKVNILPDVTFSDPQRFIEDFNTETFNVKPLTQTKRPPLKYKIL